MSLVNEVKHKLIVELPLESIPILTNLLETQGTPLVS